MENGIGSSSDIPDDDDGMLSVSDLREWTNYDPRTGAFVWRVKRKYQKSSVGDPVGSPDALGYWRVRIEGRMYQCHRLIWLYVHGRWPDELIDHINRNPRDNRLCNIRPANRSENAANKRRHENGCSGFKGVSMHRETGLLQAQIMVNGKKIYLGVHHTPEVAHAAYVAAANLYFDAFARAA